MTFKHKICLGCAAYTGKIHKYAFLKLKMHSQLTESVIVEYKRQKKVNFSQGLESLGPFVRQIENLLVKKMFSILAHCDAKWQNFEKLFLSEISLLDGFKWLIKVKLALISQSQMILGPSMKNFKYDFSPGMLCGVRSIYHTIMNFKLILCH